MNNKEKTYFIIIILGGFLGIHKFIEGKTKLGLIYLFTFGLFGFGWIYDIITFKSKTDHTTNNNNNTINTVSCIINTKRKVNYFVGQIVSVIADINKNDEECYFLESYGANPEAHKIPKKYDDYCEECNYAIIKDVSDNSLEVIFILDDIYLKRLKIETNITCNNGDSFLIKNGFLFDRSNKIGKIIDDRYNDNLNIIANSIENDILVVIIKK